MSNSDAPVSIDLLLQPDWIVPIEPAHTVLVEHDIAIDQGRIVELLPRTQSTTRYAPRHRERLPGQVLLPGLINVHTHAAMTLLRGIGDDLPLMTWLRERIWPLEAALMSDEFVYDGSVLAFAEMLTSGTTFANDMYFYPGAAARAALAIGLRAALGITVIEFPTPYATDATTYLDRGLACRDTFRDEARLHFTLAPHAPYTISDDTYRRIRVLADQLGIGIHTHLHETQDEISNSLTQYDKRPLRRLADLGVLGPDLLAVHAVHLDAADIDLLAQHGCSVGHCPGSNLKLASGFSPLAKLEAAGVNIALGTDGAASNNRQDLWSEIRLAALLAKAVAQDATAFSAHAALRAATLGGATALGVAEQLGSLIAGKYADLVAVDLTDPAYAPVFDPASHLVYVGERSAVKGVWVSGNRCVRDGALCSDTARAARDAAIARLPRWWEQARQALSAQSNPTNS